MIVPGKYHSICARFSRQCNQLQEDIIISEGGNHLITGDSKVVNELRYGGDFFGLIIFFEL